MLADCRKILLYCILAIMAQLVYPIAHAQPTTVLKQRVVQIETFIKSQNGNPARNDSIVFRYSGKRGSRFKAYNFHPGDVHGYNSYYYPEWFPLADLPEPIADANNIDVLYDSCFDFFTPAISINSKQQMQASYDGNDRIIKHDLFYRRMSSRLSRNIIERHQNGNIKEIHSISVDTSLRTTDTTALRRAHYNDEQRVVSDTIFYRDTNIYDLAFQYIYNDEGNVTEMYKLVKKPGKQWEFSEQHLLQYNTSGLLETYGVLQFNGTTWEPSLVGTLNYDNSGRLIEFSNNPVNSTPHFYTIHYNSVGLADTLTRYFSGNNIEKTAFYYNEFLNPDSAHTFTSYDTGKTFTVFIRTQYRYEQYEDTISAVPKKDIIVYPNPAGNKVTVRWNTNKPTTPVYVLVFNSTGQRVKNIYIPKTAPENTLDLSGLASGIYYMQIITEGGGKLHTTALCINND